jgi:hypothetical protein
MRLNVSLDCGWNDGRYQDESHGEHGKKLFPKHASSSSYGFVKWKSRFVLKTVKHL